jgi:hypothetical protein
MALQINGTTVINNSRNLQNIANLRTFNGQNITGSGDVKLSGVIDVDAISTGSFSRSTPGTTTQTIDISGRRSLILEFSMTRGERNSGVGAEIFINGSRRFQFSAGQNSSRTEQVAIDLVSGKAVSLAGTLGHYNGSSAITSLQVKGSHASSRGGTSYAWKAFLK